MLRQRLRCAAYENPTIYNWVMEYEGIPIGNISVVRVSENKKTV